MQQKMQSYNLKAHYKLSSPTAHGWKAHLYGQFSSLVFPATIFWERMKLSCSLVRKVTRGMQLFPLCPWPLNKLLMLANVQSNLEQLDLLDIRETAQGQDLCFALLVPKIEPAFQAGARQTFTEWMNEWMTKWQ